jgi:hypothetical protein
MLMLNIACRRGGKKNPASLNALKIALSAGGDFLFGLKVELLARP